MSDLEKTLIDILQKHTNTFLTSYQLCEEIRDNYPDIWTTLPNTGPLVTTTHGPGSAVHYTPANHIPKVLLGLMKREQRIVTADIVTKGLSINGVDSTNNPRISLWKWEGNSE